MDSISSPPLSMSVAAAPHPPVFLRTREEIDDVVNFISQCSAKAVGEVTQRVLTNVLTAVQAQNQPLIARLYGLTDNATFMQQIQQLSQAAQGLTYTPNLSERLEQLAPAVGSTSLKPKAPVKPISTTHTSKLAPAINKQAKRASSTSIASRNERPARDLSNKKKWTVAEYEALQQIINSSPKLDWKIIHRKMKALGHNRSKTALQQQYYKKDDDSFESSTNSKIAVQIKKRKSTPSKK